MSTPYTIRERKANIASHNQHEAYPGQNEKTLASLIEHDAARAARERDLAAEARAGGRALTRNIVNFRERAGGAFQAEALRTGGQKAVNGIWRSAIDPSGENGRDSWKRIALSASGQGNYPDTVYGNPERTLISLSQAEAMFDWPIYVEATNVRAVNPTVEEGPFAPAWPA